MEILATGVQLSTFYWGKEAGDGQSKDTLSNVLAKQRT
jgi:hypothetical protein